MQTALHLLFIFFLLGHKIHAQYDTVNVKNKFRWNIQGGINYSYFDGFIVPSYRDKIAQNKLSTQYYIGQLQNKHYSMLPKSDYAILVLEENKGIIQSQNPIKNWGWNLNFSFRFPVFKKIHYLLGIQIINRKREIFDEYNNDCHYLPPHLCEKYFIRFPVSLFLESKNYEESVNFYIYKLKSNIFFIELINGVDFNFKKVNLKTGINIEFFRFRKTSIYPDIDESIELKSISFIYNDFNLNSFIHNLINEFVQVEYVFHFKKFMLYPYFNIELYNHLRYTNGRTLFAWNYAFKFGIGISF